MASTLTVTTAYPDDTLSPADVAAVLASVDAHPYRSVTPFLAVTLSGPVSGVIAVHYGSRSSGALRAYVTTDTSEDGVTGEDTLTIRRPVPARCVTVRGIAHRATVHAYKDDAGAWQLTDRHAYVSRVGDYKDATPAATRAIADAILSALATLDETPAGRVLSALGMVAGSQDDLTRAAATMAEAEDTLRFASAACDAAYVANAAARGELDRILS